MDMDKKLWLNGQESCRTINIHYIYKYSEPLKGKI